MTDLRDKAFSAIRWSAIGLTTKTILQVVQVIILARFLAPSDFGLMAKVLVVIAFIRIFSDGGLTTALIQRKNVSIKEQSSLYWAGLLLASFLSALLITISPLLASYYNEPEIFYLICCLSPALVIYAASNVIRASAEKSLSFRYVMIIEVCAAFAALCVSSVMAASGFGVYCLAAALLTNSITTTFLSFIYLFDHRQLSLHFHLKEIQPFLNFGIPLVLNRVLNFFTSSLDILLAGRICSDSQLGFYTLPKDICSRLLTTINPIVNRVGLPLIASQQDNQQKLRTIYLLSVCMVVSISAPLYLAITFYAPKITNVVFGEQWNPSASILSILALRGIIQSSGNPVGSLLLGTGRPNLSLKWTAFVVACTLPTILVGMEWGIVGLALSLLGLNIVLFVPNWFFLVQPLSGATLSEYLAATAKPLALATLAISIPYPFCVQIDKDYLCLFAAFVVSFPLYIFFTYKYNPTVSTSIWNILNQKKISLLKNEIS